eukprot:6331493-Karenia_brevis.AAC.1
MDRLMQCTWAKVYAGSAASHIGATARFLSNYRQFILMDNTFELPELTVHDLMRTCQRANSSSPGMDGWSPADFKLLPEASFRWILALLQLVEEGHPWPQQLSHHKAVLVSKNPDNPFAPLEQRILQLMSEVYRLWAKTRLEHLQPWISKWALPEMHAGLKRKGADDA